MFSIIIPLYNKSPYIRRALDSVMGQTFQDYEVIVINDGSTDGGEKIVFEYGDRVKIISQNNRGVSEAKNRGIEEAQYPWIAFLDADDFWHSEYLSQIHQAIIANPEIYLFGSSYTRENFFPPIPSQLSFKIFKHYFREAVRNTYFFTSASVLKKEFFDDENQFDTSLTLGEDLDVIFRINLQNQSACYIPIPLVNYSQEDHLSAINKPHRIESSLVSKILKYNFNKKMISSQWEDFSDFRVKWVLFNLFPFFVDPQNKAAISKILKDTEGSYPLIRSFYLLNFFFLGKIFRNKGLARLFRNYMKFCFRYIYN